jgi:hypothetical protein
MNRARASEAAQTRRFLPDLAGIPRYSNQAIGIR